MMNFYQRGPKMSICVVQQVGWIFPVFDSACQLYIHCKKTTAAKVFWEVYSFL